VSLAHILTFKQGRKKLPCVSSKRGCGSGGGGGGGEMAPLAHVLSEGGGHWVAF
jgi:hypothetical protein